MEVMTTKDAARYYLDNGLRPVPIPAKKKGPTHSNWQEKDFSDVDKWFTGPQNIGIICLNGIVCVDLDHPLAIELAPDFLPPTQARIGRPSSPGSHWVYFTVDNDAPKSSGKNIRIHNPIAEQPDQPNIVTLKILDVLGGNKPKQFVVGPSIHPDTGETYDMLDPTLIDQVEWATLEEAIENLFKAVIQKGVEEKGWKVHQADGIPSPHRSYSFVARTGDRVGDLYNATDHYVDLLVGMGWKVGRSHGNKTAWTRPGKSHGISANWDQDKRIFYLFSSSVGLEAPRGYTPFSLLSHFRFNGDYKAAALYCATELGLRPPFDPAMADVDWTENQSQPVEEPVGEVEPAKPCVDPSLAHIPEEFHEIILQNRANPDEDTPVFPEEVIDHATGFIRDMMEYMLARAIKPQRHLSFGAALAACGVLPGNRMCAPLLQKTWGNLYVLALAPSGTGKDTPRSTILSAFNECGAANLLGPQDLGSVQGLQRMLRTNPSLICCIDEFQDFMKKLNNSRGASYLTSIPAALKKLKTSLGQYYEAETTKDAEQQVKIWSPFLSLVGFATPQEFAESITEDQVNGGLIGRMILFTGDPDPIIKAGTNDPVPDSIRQFIVAWNTWQPSSHANFVPSGPQDMFQPDYLPVQPEAIQLLLDHSNECERKARALHDQQLTTRAAILRRSTETAAQLAFLFAISRSKPPVLQSITPEDCAMGIKLANYSSRQMIALLGGHITYSKSSDHIFRVFRAIGKKAGDTISRSNLMVKICRHINAKELDIAIAALLETQCIKQYKAKVNGSRQATTFYVKLAEAVKNDGIKGL